MKKTFLTWGSIVVFQIALDGNAQDLPNGVSMKERTPIQRPVMTLEVKDYYRDGAKFFSDERMAVPGAPKEVRTYSFHHRGNTILSVDANGEKTHFAGAGDYRIWVSKESVTIFCLDDDYFLFIRFDESGNPLFQSSDEHTAMRSHYITNKKRYQLYESP